MIDARWKLHRLLLRKTFLVSKKIPTKDEMHTGTGTARYQKARMPSSVSKTRRRSRSYQKGILVAVRTSGSFLKVLTGIDLVYSRRRK
jgi:hypothetical protein